MIIYLRWEREGASSLLQEVYYFNRQIWNVGGWPTDPILHIYRWMCGRCSQVKFWTRTVFMLFSLDIAWCQILKKLHPVRLTKSDFCEPLNIGSDEMVSMNEMAEIVLGFDEKKLPIHHIPGPEGVRGRNSDNTLIKEKLGWAPSMKLKVLKFVIHLLLHVEHHRFIEMILCFNVFFRMDWG